MDFESLAEAVKEVRVPGSCDGLRRAFALRDRLDAAIAVAVDEVNRSGEWEIEGAVSMVAWLRTNARIGAGEAKTITTVAERTASLPVTAEAWFSGRLSSGQVKAIVANIKARRTELFAEHEAEVIPALVPLTVADTALLMAEWRRHADALDDGNPPQGDEGELFLSRSFEGGGMFKGTFGSDETQLLQTALRQASTENDPDEPCSPARRRADALVEIARFFLDHQGINLGRRHRPHLNVVVQAGSTEGGRYIDGTHASAAVIETLLCDCNLHRVLVDGRSAILDYGRSVRSAPPDLFNAVALRDGHCRMPGCDRPPEWCEAHHVIEWDDDGPTSIDNSVLKCSRHHHLWHKRRKLGWTERLEDDGTLIITDPSGRTYITHPEGPAARRQLWAS